MKIISVIRERGQLTIPDAIRKQAPWAGPLSAVSVSMTNPEEIVIRPHYAEKKIDWDDLWKQIKRARAIKGKGGGNLSAFIAKDRETRR